MLGVVPIAKDASTHLVMNCILYIWYYSPTRENKIIEPESSEPSTADIDAVESKYLLRCRECDKF